MFEPYLFVSNMFGMFLGDGNAGDPPAPSSREVLL